MWIVKIALSKPYTFIVLALLILILSPVLIFQTPTDIFPVINIPVIAVSWQYSGLNPAEMEGRITTVYERILTTTVDNIEHIESTTINGTSVVKVYLQPNASVDRAIIRIAEQLGMFHSWISKTESGDRRLDVMELMLLAELYDKTPQYFLDAK